MTLEEIDAIFWKEYERAYLAWYPWEYSNWEYSTEPVREPEEEMSALLAEED
jgi:hypothetical protein